MNQKSKQPNQTLNPRVAVGELERWQKNEANPHNCTSLLFQGCIPLQQYEITGTRPFEHLSVDNGYFMESLSRSDQPKQNRIIADESYIIGPKGSRYSLELEPHDYDIHQQHPYIRDRIYPLDSKGRRLHSIRNGDWTLYLMLESKNGKEMREFKARLWSFFYSPVVHGAPN